MTRNHDTSEFLEIFLEEAIDILSDWERFCLALEIENNSETCAALFRTAHNLKGSARSVGLSQYGKFIHTAEDLITLIRDNKIAPSSQVMRSLLETHSLLCEWREDLMQDVNSYPAHRVESISRQLLDHIEAAQVNLKKNNQAFGFFDEVEEEAENKSAAAPQESEISQTKTQDLTETRDVSLPTQALQATLSPIVSEKPKDKDKDKVSKNKANQESVRIPASRIDELMQLIGELSIQQSTILHCLKNKQLDQPICHKAIHMAAKLTRELQMQTMGLRLTSISKLFQKLERTARDLATDQSKQIRIELVGSEVELDKNVIERVSDALVHMVRNAVDHGIEGPGARANKSPEASLLLSAFQSSSGVTIQIKDDGRGIDHERVLNKARSLNLARQNENYSLPEIYSFLFAPGFSTASQITEISGRGVGLDVVRKTITDLGGTVEIQSELGKGTCFTISLPLSVSIVDSLIISASEISYVIPIQEISEVVDLSNFSIQMQNKNQFSIDIRNRSLNVIPLETFIPLKNRKGGSAQIHHKPALIVEADGHQIGLSFDRILGQQPILIRSLAEYLNDVPGFSGNTVLANGEPAIILSPKVFVQNYFQHRERAS